MLALSPSLFSSFGWPLEDPTIHDDQNNHNNNNDFCREAAEINSDQSFFHSPPAASILSQPFPGLNCEFNHSNEVAENTTMAKKLNHNASERDRRKKINCLYSTLRSLLPAADQTKKLSIPATVSRVLKYIPELQREVERLIQTKEELVSRISRKEDFAHHQEILRRKRPTKSSLSAVSASPLGEREVVIQICAVKDVDKSPLSEILLSLEEDGLILLNASCFESSGDRVFYNLHLQVQGTRRLEFETLSEKLSSMYEKKEDLFP